MCKSPTRLFVLIAQRVCLVLGVLFLIQRLHAQSPKLDGPLAPDRAIESMELERGLRIDLVAAEPLVVAPVAVAFDLHGRMFVVENRGYPIGPEPGEPPQGRIALLEDVDGDGKFDKRIEFAENLSFPNGILPWRDGAIVTCSPDILFLRDTDGDGKSDSREVIFTGFGTDGSTQLRASHPTLAPDGWIYVTNGLSGGKVISPKHPEMPPISLGRNTFRFSPDFSKAEAASGPAQFGLAFDDYGRQFVCYNRVQAQLVMLTPDVVARAPNVAISSLLHNCPIDLEAEPLVGHGAAAKIFPISQNITTADSHAGTFTAACGIALVRGDVVPPIYHGGILSCDPTANLVHFDSLVEQGAAIGARRLPGETEFLRSSDSWFRPVFLTFGPDGALYVCDMYRKTIEHPDYLPTEVRKHTDFRSGTEMGRIWRVANAGWPPHSLSERTKSLRTAKPQQIVDHLLLARCWQQDTARRLMLQEKSDELKRRLWAVFVNGTKGEIELSRAAGVAQAYEIDIDRKLETWLSSKSADQRELALRLLATRRGGEQKWLYDHASYAFDASPRVRYQLALSVGAVPAGELERDKTICEILANIASKGPLDSWTRTAILCGATGREMQLLAGLRDDFEPESIDLILLRQLATLLARTHAKEKQPEVAARAMRPFEASFSPQAAVLSGLLEVWRNQGWLRDEAFCNSLGLGAERVEMMKGFTALLATANEKLTQKENGLSERISGAALLSLSNTPEATSALFSATSPEEPMELRRESIRSLVSMREIGVYERLLESAARQAHGPEIREELLSGLLATAESAALVLSRLENGKIPLSDIDSLKRRQLTSHSDGAIRARAEKLFGAIQGNRAAVYDAYKSVAEDPGNAANGRRVFQKSCANCHRLNREGFQVGPDLFGVRNQPKATILLHILVPDQEITQGFHAYTAVLNDGRTVQGLLANETATSVTLRLPQGKEESIPRDQIEEYSKSPLSLMPQGIENTHSRQELADLLAYLKGEAESASPAVPPIEKAP